MESVQHLTLENIGYDREDRVGLVDFLLVLWMWALLFMSLGPQYIQDRYHYIPQMLLAVLALPILVRRVAEAKPFSIPREAIVYILFGAWSITGIIVAQNSGVFWIATGRLWKLGAMFLLMIWAIDSQRRLEILILYGIVGGMIIVFLAPALGIVRYELAESFSGGRETGALGNPNSLSHMAVLAFYGLLFAIATARAKWRKILAVLLLPIPIYAALIAGSRNGWVGIFTALLLVYFFYFRPRLRGRAAAKLFIIASILLSIAVSTHLLLTYSRFAYRYKNLFELVTTGRMGEFRQEGRMVMFRGELRMTRAHPLFGVGLGQDYMRLSEYSGLRPMYIHSDFAGLGGLVGIPGYILFYLIPIGLAIRAYRLSKHPLITAEQQKILLFCVIFLVGDLTRTVYGSLYAAKFSWIFWGGITGYVCKLKSDLGLRELQEVWQESASSPLGQSVSPSPADSATFSSNMSGG